MTIPGAAVASPANAPDTATGIDARIVKHLPKIRDTPAFRLDVHLLAREGITVIFGPSGSGKTLLLDSISGFVRPDEGRIIVRNELYFDAAANVHVNPSRRRCGYIFQDHALFPHMTVRQNVRFAASPALVSSGRLALHRRINEVLESFELAELAERKSAQLSGGQRQRAALARIFIAEPRVLLLDEPSRGLDTSLRQVLFTLLRSLRTRLSVPMILVSHDVEDCFQLADSVAVLDNGRILQQGLRDTVFAKPATVSVARLLGIYNVSPAEIVALNPGNNSSRIRLLQQEIEAQYLPGHLIGDTGYACMRRSDLRPVQPGSSPVRNQLTLRINQRQLTAQGVRAYFDSESWILLGGPEDTFHSNTEAITLEVPPSAITFLAK